jgi:phosphoenolpyruvate carboxykinase (GTP)
MQKDSLEILQDELDAENYTKVRAIANPQLYGFLADAIALCEPEEVWVSTDSPEDFMHTRRQALELGEERSLQIEGHTVHFDGLKDQGRDREATKYLVPGRRRSAARSTRWNVERG